MRTGSLHVSLVKTIPTFHLIHEWLRTYRIDIADQFQGLDEIRQDRCNQTGLIFFRPSRSPALRGCIGSCKQRPRMTLRSSGSTTEP